MALILPFASAALIAWPVVLAAATAGVESQTLARNGPAGIQQHQVPQVEVPPGDLSTDYDLLDIALVASVDGKFHALNRTSGRKLWSMTSFATTTSLSAPSTLAPLVRTTHTQFDSFDSNSPSHETYIIEPQSGDIYVLHSPSAPLQRFPFSMLELVEISPFTSTNGGNTQVFVGRKETSLLLIELETGRIKATLKSQCPFTPDDSKELPIGRDELDGGKPSTSSPSEVLITRTDYHVSIYTKARPAGSPTPPVQELSFSTYGPNNRDNKLQSKYRRTCDDTYIQALPNGEIVAFRTSSNKSKDDSVTGTFWGHPFPSPIVAVFDVLKQAATPHHHQPHPFVLLQPRPKLQDLFTSIDESSMYQGQPLPNQGSAHVGLVEETGSLFALSPGHYPLVVFGGHEKYGGGAGVGVPRHTGKKEGQGRIDPPKKGEPPGHGEGDGEELLDSCVLMPHRTRCLVGRRVLADSIVEWPAKRLVDGAKP